MRASARPATLFLALLLLSAISLAQPQRPANQTTLSNQTLSLRLSSASSGRPEMEISDRLTGQKIEVPDLFTITLKSGTSLPASKLRWTAPFSRSQPSTGTAGEEEVCATLADNSSGSHFRWCLLNHPDRSYMREELTITAGNRDLPIAEVTTLHFHDSSARVVGQVKGSPLADAQMFFGMENPLSVSRVSSGDADAGITRELPLRAGQSVTYSAVIGTFAPGQMRRAFLAYLENERPRRYAPFLNYNTWYDIGYTNRYSEADALDRIHAFGAELVTKRHVDLSSFVFDDGWDNPNSLWRINPGFPNGFSNVAKAAATYHAGIGVWFSPWGGYEQQKVERIAYGKAHGLEIMNDGFALSGPRYFHLFSDVCSAMVTKYDVNLFKFDGTGNADRVFPGSLFDSDFAAAIHLIHQLRRQKPGIFINLTTGTYPSPFWLFYADSIWRGGEDHTFAGVGSQRQRWITYRDEQTYKNIVLRGPLYPLNSLMLHGMIYAQKAEGLNTDPGNDFPDEVLSFFGSGTQLQEMYITPSLLSQDDWDILARAARWSRQHAAILQDTHWIGGDPGKLQVYGWAAWSPAGWIVTLRNPSSREQTYSLDLASALELPSGAAQRYTVTLPFAPGARRQWNAERPVSIQMKPFQVSIFESANSPNVHHDK
ncbi:MAG TPA: enterotoxin [Silvibacterium sp.]|nr:enterotoxin [Silvibacterium sp.]